MPIRHHGIVCVAHIRGLIDLSKRQAERRRSVMYCSKVEQSWSSRSSAASSHIPGAANPVDWRPDLPRILDASEGCSSPSRSPNLANRSARVDTG